MDYYEENISSDGLDNLLILKFKQIENQKSDIIFDDISLLVGQKRYTRSVEVAILSSNSNPTSDVIPKNTEVTLAGTKKDLNGLTVIEISS